MPDWEQRRLTTILAADVAGYSRLTGADEEGTLRRLRALRAELVDPAIAANRGRIFKTTGDGLLAEFASVVDAARCALDVQRAMTRRNEDFVPEKRIAFRVGIHLGDVLVEADGDLMGDGVNIAARLEGIAESGGICLSNAAYEQVRDRIDAAFTDLGEEELKNIARPVRVYSIGPHSVSSPSPPLGGEGRVRGAVLGQPTTSPSRAVGAGPSLSATRRGEDGPSRLSIVVLPFANIGGDPEQDYFVDGVTESLTTDLSRISGSFVIGRNTAFTYKGKAVDLKQIGRELGVRYVLEGSVQRGGNRLRVNVQLIEAESGAHLWAERFDKPVADLFDMQDEIVARLANQLNAELIAAEARRAERNPNPDSMDLYFQGVVRSHAALTAENLTAARDLFERALTLDPGNVDALAGLANADFMFAGGLMVEDGPARLAVAEATALKALTLAPNHVGSHLVLSYVYLLSNRLAQAIATAERILALDRNMAAAHAIIGQAKLYDGRAEETEAHILDALRLSPRDTQAYFWMFLAGAAKGCLGQYEEAVAWLRRSIETWRHFQQAHFVFAASLVRLGRLDEARAAARAGFALDPGFTVRRARAMLTTATNNPVFLAQVERSFNEMRQAGVPEG